MFDSRIKRMIHMCWQRLYPFGAWLALTTGAAGIALALFLVTHVWEHRRLELPRNLGNARAAALVAQRDTPPDLVKFAIIGDINNGTETFEAAVSRLRVEHQVAFLVLLGDCAADPIRDLHMYFVEEYAETGLDLPTFIVAGNHDVEPGKFGYSELEELYGPANFALTYRDDLFISLGGIHDQERLGETLSFLEKTLQERRTLAKRVFVFMHYPPAASDYVPTVRRDEMKKFQSLLEQYKVTYVFSGHCHRLARTDVNGVVYLVTGGGGARLRNDRFQDIGLFHHIAIIEMRENVTAEHIIPVAPAGRLSIIMERIERKGLTVLLPWLRQHPVMGVGVTMVIIAAFFWGAVDRWRYSACLRSCKPCGTPTSGSS